MDYARLVVGFNLTASTFYPLFSWRVDCLSHVLDRAEVLIEAAQQLEEKERLPPAGPPRNWRRLKREISVPEFLRGLAREEQESVAPEADGLWLELDALRRLQEEAIEQIGEDPAQPATAAAGESAWKAVDGLRQRLGFKKAPPPDPEVLRQFREYMDAVSGADDLEIPR
jgi:hypothetical protein